METNNPEEGEIEILRTALTTLRNNLHTVVARVNARLADTNGNIALLDILIAGGAGREVQVVRDSLVKSSEETTVLLNDLVSFLTSSEHVVLRRTEEQHDNGTGEG